MLFILTGDIQTGKTRWLQRLTEDLQQAGVEVAGVIAPGVWREREDSEPSGQGGPAGASRYEKLGINNYLLPQGEEIAFARRRDLAQAEGTYNPKSQSAKAQLGWEISDAAIADVNEHFDLLADEAAITVLGADVFEPALLVVDELGQLELKRDGGLTEAVDLLDTGPTGRFPHALVVVREWLYDDAVERFGDIWGKCVCLYPDEGSRQQVAEAFEVELPAV